MITFTKIEAVVIYGMCARDHPEVLALSCRDLYKDT